MLIPLNRLPLVLPVVPMIIEMVVQAPETYLFLPVVPESSSRFSSFEGHEESHILRSALSRGRPTRGGASWCSLDISQIVCSRWRLSSSGCLQAHYVAGPPNSQRHGPRESVSDFRMSSIPGPSFSYLDRASPSIVLSIPRCPTLIACSSCSVFVSLRNVKCCSR